MDPRQFGDALEGELRASFLTAVEAALNLLDENELVQLIKGGKQRDIVLLVERLYAEGFVPSSTRYVQAMLAAATAAGASTLTGVTAAAGLQRLSPRVLEFIRREGGKQLQEMGEAQMRTVARIVEQGVREGVGAQKLGRQIRDSIGLLDSHERAHKRYKEALEAKVNAGEMRAETADRNAEIYRQRLIAWRADMIARTESMRAAHGGLVEGWRANQDAGYLPRDAMMEWYVTEDDRTCARCAPMANHPPVRVRDGKFVATEKGFPDGMPEWGTSLGARRKRKGGIKPGTEREEWREEELDGITVKLKVPIVVPYPPLHPNCRCTLRLVIQPA